jgi:hypothetical protein
MGETPVLVGIMNSRRDWDIVRRERWYRIPLKSAPRGIRAARFLAFYQTKVFGPERWAINYYAPIVRRRVVALIFTAGARGIGAEVSA